MPRGVATTPEMATEYAKLAHRKRRCPYCGETVDDGTSIPWHIRRREDHV